MCIVQGHLVSLDNKDGMASVVFRVSLDPLGPRDQQVLMDYWVLLGHKETRDRLASQVSQEQLAYLAELVRGDRVASLDNQANLDELVSRV